MAIKYERKPRRLCSEFTVYYIYIERVRLTTKEAPSLKVNIVYEQDAFSSCILAETLPFW